MPAGAGPLAAVPCCHPCLGSVAGGPPRIRNVYIPSDQLKVLFDSSPKGVLMPREKVLALWQEAQRNVQAGAVPPDEVVLTRATYDARLDERELRITGRIEGMKLGGQWQAVDLPFGGLAIESAQLGGEPARFGRKDDGTLLLLVEKEGRFELALELSAPLAGKGGDMAATLRLPPVPASEILLELDERRQVQLDQTILQPESTGAEEQRFRIAVDPTGLVPLVVSDRLAGGNRAPLVFAHSRSVGHVEPAGLRWEVTLDLEVCARATDSFELQLPASVDVAEVERRNWPAGRSERRATRGGHRAQVPQATARPPRRSSARLGADSRGCGMGFPRSQDAPGRLARRRGAGVFSAFAAGGAGWIGRHQARAIAPGRGDGWNRQRGGADRRRRAVGIRLLGRKLPTASAGNAAARGVAGVGGHFGRAGSFGRRSAEQYDDPAAARRRFRSPDRVASRLGSHFALVGQPAGRVGVATDPWHGFRRGCGHADRAIRPCQAVEPRPAARNRADSGAASGWLAGRRRTIQRTGASRPATRWRGRGGGDGARPGAAGHRASGR